jgi:hypothetical protein
VARHIFQACPVWIYTQSNITQASIRLSTLHQHSKYQGRIVYNRHGMTKWRRIGQSCGFTLLMVKQLESAWNLFKTCLIKMCLIPLCLGCRTYLEGFQRDWW